MGVASPLPHRENLPLAGCLLPARWFYRCFVQLPLRRFAFGWSSLSLEIDRFLLQSLGQPAVPGQPRIVAQASLVSNWHPSGAAWTATDHESLLLCNCESSSLRSHRSCSSTPSCWTWWKALLIHCLPGNDSWNYSSILVVLLDYCVILLPITVGDVSGYKDVLCVFIHAVGWLVVVTFSLQLDLTRDETARGAIHSGSWSRTTKETADIH